jgi:hypothetical protein
MSFIRFHINICSFDYYFSFNSIMSWWWSLISAPTPLVDIHKKFIYKNDKSVKHVIVIFSNIRLHNIYPFHLFIMYIACCIFLTFAIILIFVIQSAINHCYNLNFSCLCFSLFSCHGKCWFYQKLSKSLSPF